LSTQSNRIRTQLLVLRCQSGDENSFRELIQLWEKPLLYYIRRIVLTQEDAWDVLQEVWINVVSKVRQIRNPACASVWLYRIARNTAFNSWRQKMKTEPLDEKMENQLHDDSDPMDDLVSAEDAEAIHRALGQVPLPQREALTLFFLEDLSLQEISELTEVPVGTVKSRLHHGRNKMRELLREEDFGNV